MKYLVVNIYHNGDVDNEVVNLSKGDGDVVIWQNQHHHDFTIQFKTSPFASGATIFTVPARSAISSGPLNNTVQSGVIIDYTIQSSAMAMASDPGIKIKP
jgi:hypothetical protein